MSEAGIPRWRQSFAVASPVLVRWLVGALFVYMGLNKALHPVEFLKLVRQYDLFATHVPLNLIAMLLPWFEVFCGLLLIAGVAVRGAALTLLAMLIPFTAVVIGRALALQSASHLAFCAIKFDCGCGAGEVLICRKIVENTVLALLCVGLVCCRQGRLSLRYALQARA
jgi:uncharacterized membrane protein YphA (DoxX/SURF4 family)